MQELDEYRKLVKKQIKRLSGPIGQEILKDEQAIGDIMTEVMIADTKHDATKGRTRKCWLNQHAIYGTYDYVNRKKKKQKIGDKSCYFIGEDDSIAHNKNEFTNIDDKETVSFLLENSGLTKKQRFVIEQKFLYNRKTKDIAQELGVSLWGVLLSIKSGIKKMRKKGLCSKI